LASFLLGSVPGEAGTLGEELLGSTPLIFDYLRKREFKNVGVLKFRVKGDEDPRAEPTGPLILNLATRIELALAVTNDARDPIGVIRDAGAVAAKIRGADHLEPDGRRALFQRRYRLAWGNEEVEADAFLTGLVEMSPDLSRLTVWIMGFGRDSAELEPVVKFTAAPDPPTLSEAGESFLVRGMTRPDGQMILAPPEAAATSAGRIRQDQQPHPIRDPEAPVALEIYYDKMPVPLEGRGSQASVREPREGQEVLFVLRKLDRSPIRYGVILRVNGRNTCAQERPAEPSQAKWVLSQNVPAIPVRGYQVEEGKAEPFRVASREESRRSHRNYGPDVGTIELVVYREKTAGGGGAAPGGAPADGGPRERQVPADERVVDNGRFPERPAEGPAELKYQLRASVSQPSASRGLIQGAGEVASKVRWIPFLVERDPVMSARIKYYRPE
jgi:hypothetical protein